MKRIYYGFITLMVIGLVWATAAPAADSGLSLKLAQSTIKISTFYNGTTLDVSGTVPADSDVMLQVSGPKKDVHLKVKGKVAGFLWMNKTDASLSNTPAVYMAYLPAGKAEDELGPELGIGYDALSDQIAIEPESLDKGFVFTEYVKLMEKAGVYAIHEGLIKYGPVNGGVKPFSVTMAIPSKMAAGDYQVQAIAVKDGKVVDRTEEKLTLELSGLPKAIANLAYGQPLLFGIMAVVIAVAAGLLIGALFKGGGGAH